MLLGGRSKLLACTWHITVCLHLPQAAPRCRCDAHLHLCTPLLALQDWPKPRGFGSNRVAAVSAGTDMLISEHAAPQRMAYPCSKQEHSSIGAPCFALQHMLEFRTALQLYAPPAIRTHLFARCASLWQLRPLQLTVCAAHTPNTQQDAPSAPAGWSISAILAKDPLANAVINSPNGEATAFFWCHHTFSHENLDNATTFDADQQIGLNQVMAGSVSWGHLSSWVI